MSLIRTLLFVSAFAHYCRRRMFIFILAFPKARRHFARRSSLSAALQTELCWHGALLTHALDVYLWAVVPMNTALSCTSFAAVALARGGVPGKLAEDSRWKSGGRKE